MIVLNETPDFDPPCANLYPPMGDPVYTLGAFSFTSVEYSREPFFLPLETPEGEYVRFDVTFTPPSPGFYSEYLGIFSNDSIDPPGMYAFLPLEGTGVSATVPVPGALLLGGVGAAIIGLVRRRVA